MKKLLCLVMVLLLVGCSSPVKETGGMASELLVSDQLIIGTSPDYPPFESLDTDNQLVGFDIDLMNAVVAVVNQQNNTNLVITWKQMDFTIIIGALQANQIDIGVSGFTYDAERDVLFSTPYIYSQQVVVVNNDSNIESISDLTGKKIGVQTGSTGEGAVGDLDNITIVSVSDVAQLFAQLKTKAIDAFVLDKAVAENYVLSNDAKILNEVLVDENMSIIIAKSKTGIQKAIDAALAEYMDSEAYQELLVKWGLQ